jgi:hypothetical protein
VGILKTLQEKLDETARAVEPILWAILDEIERDNNENKM